MSQDTGRQGTEPQETKCHDTACHDTWPQKQTVLRFIMKLASVLLVLWAVFTFVFALHIMKGESMYPRLRDGDLYLSYRLVQNYDIDDVVSFEQNGMVRTARVVAQGGDVVDLTDNGQLIINGHIEQEEIFYVTLPDTASDVTYPYTVEEGSYFLLCDFRTGSSDSRTYGAFSQDVIEGKVISVFRHRGI